MKFQYLVLVFFALSACQDNPEPVIETNNTQSFFLGTYTDGESEGIYLYDLKEDGTIALNKLMARSQNPSFLAMDQDQKTLLAVNELDSGTIESFKILPDSLTFINRSSTGGAHPCFVSINENSFVLAANYTGGNVGLLNLNDDGSLSELLFVQQHSGNSIKEQQKSPHAHAAWFVPNSNEIVAVDLGTDELWLSKLENDQLTPSSPDRLAMAPGAGPRHLTIHPNRKWFYVVNELDATVTRVERNDAGDFLVKESVSTLPADYNDQSYCADIHVSADGRFVYASNRGHNSIAIFSVNLETGFLSPMGHESTRGDWPRNFALSPNEDILLVANQRSNNITSYKRDKNSGLLEFVNELKAPSPVCILFK
jgi:6-phosphogluconolactonase